MSKLLFKARSNSLKTNERRHRWRGERNVCGKCERRGEGVVESLEHLIKVCPWYREERDKLERSIVQRVGVQTWENIKGGDNDMEFILGINKEEGDVTEETKIFLGEMWKKRKGEGRYDEEEQEDHNYSLVAREVYPDLSDIVFFSLDSGAQGSP